MDLSINKVKRANNLNFQGVKGAYSASNIPVFKFVPPEINKEIEQLSLELAFLRRDSQTGQFVSPSKSDLMLIPFKEDDSLELLQEKMQKYAQDGAFAYRYRIDLKSGKYPNPGETYPKYVVDEANAINIKASEEKVNVIDMGYNYGITPKGGSMRHSFIDSDAIVDTLGKLNKTPNKEFVRNHFNKLGGSIKGLNLLLEEGYFDSYRYIISTPDIGVDPTSSHKYWPSNQYQCSDMEEFKKFNFNLFEKGKGYVADGAFTSQGIQSPIVQHVLKWGEQSPYYNMLKINGRLQLGILPDKNAGNETLGYDEVGVKIINSPKHDGYDSKKPTYMQFFDTKLSSEEQRNSNELISSYDKLPEDHYDVVDHQDAVQPYYFELDPTNAQEARKIAMFGDKKSLILNDIKDDLGDFLTFANYTIAHKQHAAGAVFWDGNRDIIKMNLSNPEKTPENRQGLKDARNYLFNVASFWTEAIQSELILETARKHKSEQEKIAQNNDITKEQLENIERRIADGTFNLPVLKRNKTAAEYIQEFPLQSIETSPELSAIFAQKEFNNEFLTEEVLTHLEKTVEDAIFEAIPDEYKNMGADSQEYQEYKTYVTKTYSNEIIKNILVGAMCPQLINDDASIDFAKLKDITLKSFQKIKPSTPQEERKQIVKALQNGLDDSSTAQIVAKMKKELDGVSLKDFKYAEAIVEQGKGGLNWRFDAAKDIGDLDAIRDGRVRFSTIWDGGDMEGVVEFWEEFIGRVHEYNPASYIISEITDLWSFWKYKEKEGMKEFPGEHFDKGLHVPFDKKYPTVDQKDKAPDTEKPPYVKEMQFLNKVNSTTSSNYNNYFNNLAYFIGADAESANGDCMARKGNLNSLKGQMENLTTGAQPNVIILSHMFTDNHDKPRLLHSLPIDITLYLKGTLKEVNVDARVKQDLFYEKSNPKEMSSKAYAVALKMREIINSKYNPGSDKNKALMQALRELLHGQKSKDSEYNFRRAEAFGTLPYEVTIRDVFKRAKGGELTEQDEKEIQEMHWTMVGESAWKEEKLIQVMGALTGVPTLYNGAEYAQTGYESSSKNKYVANRGQVLHNLKDEANYSEFYKKVNADIGLYQKTGLSALRNGFPISLDVVDRDLRGVHPGAFSYIVGQLKQLDATQYAQLKKEVESSKTLTDTAKNILKSASLEEEPYKNQSAFAKISDVVFDAIDNPAGTIPMWPIYKYDEQGSKVISVVTALKIDEAYGESASVSSIALKKDGKSPLPDGTKLRRYVYDKNDYTIEKKDGEIVEYIVEAGAIKRIDKQKIVLNDTVSTFYVPNEKDPKYRASVFNQTK
ncbi:MAG: hypothetical protein IJ003_04880 [Candidatus Gastranaerophilales bacterium]|nr:hypothetical protein [Candidatus Gastranaerophilales bacterium]